MSLTRSLLILLSVCAPLLAQEATEPPADEDPLRAEDPLRDGAEEHIPGARPEAGDFKEITPQLEQAVERGLAFLAEEQRADGSVGQRDYCIAITAMAGLAWMSGGSTLQGGPYAEHVRRACEFYLDLRDPGGDERWHIALADDKSRLHGHGYATLFLAQCHGTAGGWERAEELNIALRQAVNLILRSQERQGGWGYMPNDAMHEGSITVTQLQALRAARDAGIAVPARNITRALDYLEKSKSERPEWVYFVYRLGTSSSPSFPLAAAAISSLNAVGKYRSDTVDKGLAFLRRYLPGERTRAANVDERFDQFWYYGQLYAVQAMFQSGGSDWELWFPAIRDVLIRKQTVRRDGTGSWGSGEAESIYGLSYPTAVACIILQVPYRLLPILRR